MFQFVFHTIECYCYLTQWELTFLAFTIVTKRVLPNSTRPEVPSWRNTLCIFFK